MARILAAMSGGVDSSVAAALLIREGHDVVGAYMKNWINEENIVGHCPWMEDIDDARAVADQLGIEFHVVNLMRDYREKVVKYLLEGYQSGITPNPDVMCNREMKFGVLWEWAREHGFDAIATGHYARKGTLNIERSTLNIESNTNRPDAPSSFNVQCSKLNVQCSEAPVQCSEAPVQCSSTVLRGTDPNKDQTYFLAMMRPEQVGIARFPIGHLLKPELRAIARELKLKTAEKKTARASVSSAR